MSAERVRDVFERPQSPQSTPVHSVCDDMVLEATSNQDIPFGVLVDALHPVRATGHTFLFQICLTLQPADEAGTGGALTLGAVAEEPIDVAGEHSLFDLSLDVTEQAEGGGFHVSVEYSTELFDADRVDGLLDHFTALTGGLTDSAHDIELMSPEGHRQVLSGCVP